MSRFANSKTLYRAVLTLVIFAIFFFFLQIKPLIQGIFQFIGAVLVPFLIAMMISYLLHPIVNLLSERRVPKSIAVLLIYSVFVICIIVLVMNMAPIIERQLYELIEHIPEWNHQVQQMIQEYNDHGKELLPNSVQNGIEESLSKIEKNLGSMVTDMMSGIGSTINQIMLIFIIPFLAFYMMKDADELEQQILKWLPRERRLEMIRLFRNIDQALGNYIRGQFLVCLVVGMLAYIGYLIIGVPYALLLAGAVSVFNIIPYLGPFIGAIPAILVALVVSKKMVIGVLIVNVVVQMLEGNVVSPQIVGRSLHLHPLTIIMALLIGEEVGGFIGLILAVPVFAVAKVIAEHFLEHYISHRT